MTADAVLRAVHGMLLPGFTGTRPPAWLQDAARTGLAGVVLFAHNTPDPATTADLSARLHRIAPALLVATDEEGGDVSRLEAADGSSLPGAAALGLLDDEAATRAAGEALGRLLAAVGVDLDLAPVLDVDRPENPVIGVRSFGGSPDLVARHGAAFVAGLHRGGVGACGKHFPGHGSTTVDSHLELPVVTDDLEVLRRRDLVPFAATLPGAGGIGSTGGTAAMDDGHLDAVMTAHVRVPAIGPEPASLEPGAARLARELGLTGPVITDALDMRAVSDGADVGEVAVRAVEGGADLLCLGTTVGRDDAALFAATVAALVAAVRSGRLPLDRLAASRARTDALVARVRALRAAAGTETGTASDVERARREHRALADLGRRLARDAVRPGPTGGPALADRPGPDVLDLRLRLDHAAGRKAEHVQRAVRGRWPDAVCHPPLDDAGFADLLASLSAATRPLVVVTRDPAPGGAERARLEAAVAARPDLVVVHTGLPASQPAVAGWFASLPGGPPPVVSACGAGAATARAAVELLATGWPAARADGTGPA